MKADTRVQTTAPGGMASRIKSIVGGSIGNAIEYYDWYVYSAFSFYFAPVFFPSGNPTAQLLNVAGVFAVGFFMRPVGGWILGLYADRHGRRAALLVSVVAMCLGSLTIGLLPGYASIGLLSPTLLVVARLLQGLSLGGEYASLAAATTPVAAMLPILLALAIVGLYSSVSAIAKAELFPVEIRALGVGLPYSLTVSVFGGTAEYVALWLKNAGHESWFYGYVAACSFATLVCVVLMRDTKRHSRIEND